MPRWAAATSRCAGQTDRSTPPRSTLSSLYDAADKATQGWAKLILVQSGRAGDREAWPAVVDGIQGSDASVARETENYFAALIAAQRLFWAAAIFRRAAALTWRFFGAAAVVSIATGFLGGRPRRFSDPPSAWIARSRRSRSAIKRATICSMGIKLDVIIRRPLYTPFALVPNDDAKTPMNSMVRERRRKRYDLCFQSNGILEG